MMRTIKDALNVRIAWKPAATAKCMDFRALIITLTMPTKRAESELKSIPTMALIPE
jgi:hypothetical protein